MGLAQRSCLFLSFSSLCSLFLAIIHLLLVLLLPAASAIPISTSNETDRLALPEFKAKITDDPLGVITNSWNGSLHFCQWYGVTCGRRHQRVTVLNLSSLKLLGSISPHVGNLSFLRELRLENNSFSREIPPQIGHLRRLQILALHNNSIGGQIPDNISACSNLRVINLSRNMLIGEIPLKITSLMKLEVVILNTNNLTGTVPPSLGNISSLHTIYLIGNNLQGVVHESLGQLINLRVLALGRNRFSGTIPSSVFNLSSIEILDLGYNQLEGTLQTSFSLPRLQYLRMSYNQFTGSIPTSISNATILGVLLLNVNNLTGIVPSLKHLNKLSIFNNADNNLGSGRDDDDLNFVSDLTNATALRFLIISMNNFGGKLPEHIANLSNKLEGFVIRYNQIGGNVPSGIGNLISLKVLSAPWNKLSGTIPTTIGKLNNLNEFHLQSNNFTGNIPSSLGNLTNLLDISLSYNSFRGMIPSSLGNCKNLQWLDFSNNNLTGPMPHIFELSSSISLDLSTNHFYGSLPNEVGNLKQLGLLSLRDNMFSGQIPAGLGSCTSIEYLYMDANLLQGSVPSSLSSMRGIRELNLSHNNLSGKIPEFFTDFRLIELLDISFNDFEGLVPIQGIFENASAAFIQGNKNLCGGIRDFGLPACKFKQEKGTLAIKLRIIIIVVSALIGTALILTCLFHWRRSRKGQPELASSSFENELLKLSYQSLLKATNGFSMYNLIGSGSFGTVYKGILDEDGLVIAVKVLGLMRRGAAKSFLAECQILRNVRHRNLVKVLTACSGVDFQGNDFKALVYEFMDNGSLDEWLHPSILGLDEGHRTLNVIQRLNISIDVACALEYLHSHSGTPIVHCDLKPSNVLLDKEMTAHVSDFGLVKFLSDGKLGSSAIQSSSIGARGTIGYCPPEYGLGGDVSTSGDIYSFGILVLEMFTGKRPTDDMFKEGLTIHNFVKKGLTEQATKMTEIIDCNIQDMRKDVDATSNQHHNLIECMISTLEIGINCSAELPQERMNIRDVVVQLSSIRSKFLGTRGDQAAMYKGDDINGKNEGP